jgi:hypothetical protein
LCLDSMASTMTIAFAACEGSGGAGLLFIVGLFKLLDTSPAGVDFELLPR